MNTQPEVVPSAAVRLQIGLNAGVLITLLTILIGGIQWATKIDLEVSSLRRDIGALTSDRWKGLDQMRYVSAVQDRVELWRAAAQSAIDKAGVQVQIPPLVLPTLFTNGGALNPGG